MAGLVKGKVALVTGAGSGIGRATALAFAQQGAKVIVSDIDPNGGGQTVEMIAEIKGKAVFVKADVSNEAEVQALIEKAEKTYGRIDCAVNNAGIDGDTALTADCSRENWDRVIGLNLTGVFLCMKYEIPVMLKQGAGAIVNTASTMGIVAHQNVPAYVASKHAVVGLTKSTALGYVKDGIRVNAICPGNTHTPLFDHVIERMPEVYETLMAATPIGRLAHPSEIGNAIVWMCSDQASYMTGHAMVVDGCYSIQ